ncbi:T9SS type A sorting domain-containing protein [Polaribacter sp.]|uniref:T9SS type A sorting domain-containing protein n=1 Tax=Polaribacter sp. TaxID=1920175 RepID=UPI003EF48EB2
MKKQLHSKLSLSLALCLSLGLVGNIHALEKHTPTEEGATISTTSSKSEFVKAATTAFYFAGTDYDVPAGCSKYTNIDEDDKYTFPKDENVTALFDGGTLGELKDAKPDSGKTHNLYLSDLTLEKDIKIEGDGTGNVTLNDVTSEKKLELKSKGGWNFNMNGSSLKELKIGGEGNSGNTVILNSTITDNLEIKPENGDLQFFMSNTNSKNVKVENDDKVSTVIVGGVLTDEINLKSKEDDVYLYIDGTTAKKITAKSEEDGKRADIIIKDATIDETIEIEVKDATNSFADVIIANTSIGKDITLKGNDGKLSLGAGTTFKDGQKITGGDKDTFELSIEAGLVSKIETYGGTTYNTINAAALSAASADLADGDKIYLTIDGDVIEVKDFHSLTFFNGTVPTTPTIPSVATGPIKTAVAGTNNWGTAAAWSPASLPTACEDVIIATSANITIPSGTINANKLTVEAGASLTIDPSASLNLAAGEVLTINSSGTESGVFIGKGYTGQITYNRYVDNQWHIISSMVTDQSLNGFATNAANDITTGDGGTKYALGPYSPIADAWVYFTTATIAAAGDFAENVGYTFKRNTAGFATFTGTNNDGDATTTVLAKGVSNGYRSLGNPYPSYMDVNVGTPNFVTANDGILAAGAKNIFLFDLVTGKYLSIGDASADKYIIPGQGFLIKTDAGGTATISEDLQSIQSGGTLSRSTSSEITRIAMSISSGSLLGKANVYFHENGAKGMDNDDYLVFTDYDFDIYSKLLDGSYADNNFNTQSLPNKDYETMVVSLGINAAINSTVEFSFTHEALPAGYMLFLEDKELATMTRVDDGTTYSAVINANGTGRFFLHTSTSVLATETTIASKVAIFSANNSVQINGLSLGKTTVTMYDLLGRIIVKDSFSDKNSHVIATSSLNKGSVYIVDIETTDGKVTKKVIIQ